MNARTLASTTENAAWTATPVNRGVLQRQCACGQHTVAGGTCEACSKSGQTIQRRSGGGAEPSHVPPIVHDVLRTPGQPLGAATRNFMEPVLAAEFSRVPARAESRPDNSQPLRIGPPGDAYEREADRIGDAVARRPAAASMTNAKNPGQPAGVDLSNVRLHTGARAAESARAINAAAYTVGRDVVVGAGMESAETAAGKRTLAHELTHVVQQGQAQSVASGTVQRVGIFESIARFFGGGTFSDQELEAYIEGRRATQKIEDEFDSDNKARAIVEKGKFEGEGVEIQALLIQEMLSGSTGSDDRKAILTILEMKKKDSPDDLERIVNKVGMDPLVAKFSGDDKDRLYILLGSVKKHATEPVGTEWWLGYSLQGAEDLLPRGTGIAVDDMTALPTNGEPLSVAQAAANATASGAATKIASAVQHPRGVGGAGNLAFHVAPKDSDGSMSMAPSARVTANYSPPTLDKRRITATLDVKLDREKIGEEGTTTGAEKQKAAAAQDSFKKTAADETAKQTKHTAGSNIGGSLEVGVGAEEQHSTDTTSGDSETSTETVTIETEVAAETGTEAAVTGREKLGLGALAEVSVEETVKGTFKVSAKVKGSVANSLATTHHFTIRTGKTNSTKIEAKGKLQGEVSQSDEKSSGTKRTTGTEVGASQTRTNTDIDRNSKTRTSMVLVPVIKEASIKFDVT